MSLVKYIIRRVLTMIPILLGVIFITFILGQFLPGNPYEAHAINKGTQAERDLYEALVIEYGADKPILEQFWIYFSKLLQGDWGESVSMSWGTPVWFLISNAFPRTLEIAILSVFFATIIGMRVGIISAVHRNKWQDTLIRFIALFGVAVPVFWLGLLVRYFITGQLQLLPGIGYRDPLSMVINEIPKITGSQLIDSILSGNFAITWEIIQHLIMPVFCLTFIFLAGIVRQTRSSMLEVLELDYIRTARSKGAKENDVINKHALKNALIPTITVVGMNFGGLLSGAVLTETTFDINGMGMLMMSAINTVDYFVLSASVFLVSLLFIIVNLITDIIYGIVDPRIRFE